MTVSSIPTHTSSARPTVTAHTFDSPTKFVGVSLQDDLIEQYRGIKFAHIDRRWSNPVVVNGYKKAASDSADTRVVEEQNFTVYDATKFGPIAPQPFEDITGYYSVPENVALPMPAEAVQDEFELLNLVITRPSSAIPRKGPLPVMVFIHGGSNTTGTASNPLYSLTKVVARAAITDQPIITVQIQYRLGALGWMYVNGQGNWGLMDQKAALGWVNRHIADWGGDKNNVSVVGLSAGSCNSYYQTVMELPSIEGAPQEEANGNRWFKRAAFMSGVGSTMPLRSIAGQQALKRQIASEIFDTTIPSDETDLDHLLSSAPLDTIIRASVQPSTKDSTYIRIWYPTIDNKVIKTHDHEDVTIPHSLTSVMLSDTADEGLLFAELAAAADPDRILPLLSSTKVGAALASAYNLRSDLRQGLQDLLSDCVFTHPITKFAKTLQDQGGKPVYKLCFDSPNPFNPTQGCIHGTDMVYLFAAYLPGGKSSDLDGFDHVVEPLKALRVSQGIQDLYIQFCHHGVPWKQSAGNEPRAILFSREYEVKPVHGAEELAKLRRTKLEPVIEEHGAEAVHSTVTAIYQHVDTS